MRLILSVNLFGVRGQTPTDPRLERVQEGPATAGIMSAQT